jgi:hypothetical protein
LGHRDAPVDEFVSAARLARLGGRRDRRQARRRRDLVDDPGEAGARAVERTGDAQKARV